MIAVITAKPVVGSANQSLFRKSPMWSSVSVQLRTPNSKSTIHRKMFTATTTGVAQTSTSPIVRSKRMKCPSRPKSSAISVPKNIVSPTFTNVNTNVRRTTVQNCRSWARREKLSSPIQVPFFVTSSARPNCWNESRTSM